MILIHATAQWKLTVAHTCVVREGTLTKGNPLFGSCELQRENTWHGYTSLGPHGGDGQTTTADKQEKKKFTHKYGRQRPKTWKLRHAQNEVMINQGT